jgi:hypothetical protein
MNKPDEIIYANDLQLLGYILGEFADIIMLLEDSEDKIKLLASLSDFYAIHKTRTNDLLKLQRSIGDARIKHKKVIAERNEYYKNWKDAEKKLNEYMERNIG